MAWLLLLSLLAVVGQSVIAVHPKTAELGMGRSFMIADESSGTPDLPPEIETHYYMQTIDHFNYNPQSYTTFRQKYLLNSKYWGGSNTSDNLPIFVVMGDEANITLVATYLGFINELASHFNGLIVYIEHRYYGDSMPFGVDTYKNGSTLGYFSSTQALADYAQLITQLKTNLSAQNSPVIAVGGSYGGMLASWFRLKYPHIVYGALASSAPILYFDDITPQNAYLSIVTKDYRDISENCYKTIRDSWSEIDKVAAAPNGLQNLTHIFNSCYPLNSSKELKDDLILWYNFYAQNDNPPNNGVERICKGIDGTVESTYILDKIVAGFKSLRGSQCSYFFDLTPSNKSGWIWQTCTEMVMPIGCGENETMFQAMPFDLEKVKEKCEALFSGVTPRPHWITTEFGGHDIKSVLIDFASNIIFYNGGRDPYSGGGVLQNISDSVVALYADKGAHGSDLGTPMATDPSWLVSLRNSEMEIIQGWLSQYNV